MLSTFAIPMKGYDQLIIRQQKSSEVPRSGGICSVEVTRYRSTQEDYPNSRRRVFNKPPPSTPVAVTDITEDMMKRGRALAALPNESFIIATDLNKNREDIMSMDPTNRSETQAILDDSDIMSALKRADRQYKEGRAKSLRDLIKDLGFEVDALRD